MLALGLTAAEMRELVRALGTSHSIRTRVHVLDLEHNHVADVTSLLLDGQVDGKAEENKGWRQSRSSQISLWDPAFKLGFDTTSPHEGQLFADRMIQITYGVQLPDRRVPVTPPAVPGSWAHVPHTGLPYPLFEGTDETDYPPASDDWVDIPVFTGPVVGARRDGPTLTVEALGKEHLAARSSYITRTFKKGARRVDVIRELLQISGEVPARMVLPSTNHRLPADLVLDHEDNLWDKAIHLAFTTGYHLYYDARGTARMEVPSNGVVFTFRDGTAATPNAPALVMSQPKPSFDNDNIINVVRVEGAPKEPGKPSNIAVTWAPPAHPLSPHQLGRNGTPRILLQVIEDQEIRTVAEATALSEDTLQSNLRKYVHVAVDALPVPFLEPWDMCAIQTKDVIVPTFRLAEYSLPLSAAGVMSVGARRSVQQRRRA